MRKGGSIDVDGVVASNEIEVEGVRKSSELTAPCLDQRLMMRVGELYSKSARRRGWLIVHDQRPDCNCKARCEMQVDNRSKARHIKSPQSRRKRNLIFLMV